MNLRIVSRMKCRLLPRGAKPRAIRFGYGRGLTMDVDLQHRTQLLLGLYERELLPHLERQSSIANSAIDIGANEGFYSLAFLARSNIQNVIAVEPDSEARTLLGRNLALNPELDSTRLTIITDFVGSDRENGMETLDHLTRELRAPILVKLDVDGGELDVLQGSEALLSRLDSLWLIETHSWELENACIEFLEQRGYQTCIIPNAGYRAVIPENRQSAHNRWLSAEPRSQIVG